jgi:hypothetical protein
MPYARKDLLTWQEGMYYHIYNRGVSKSALFREPVFFPGKGLLELQKMNHLQPVKYCSSPKFRALWNLGEAGSF